MALGRRGRLSLRMPPKSIADLRGPLEHNSAMHFTEREWAPQTLIFARSPIPRQSSPGTKDSYTHPTIPSAGRTGSVLTRLFKQSFFLRLLPIRSHTVHRIIKTPQRLLLSLVQTLRNLYNQSHEMIAPDIPVPKRRNAFSF